MNKKKIKQEIKIKTNQLLTNLNKMSMKKVYLILAAAVGMTITSCTTNDYLGDVNNDQAINDGSIKIGAGFKALTRADHVGADAAAMLNKKFIVGGFKGDGTTMTQVFDNYTVEWEANTAGNTASNTSDWEYVGKTPAPTSKISGAQTIKYWDYSASQYDFAAFSTGKVVTVNTEGTASAGVIVITPIAQKIESSQYKGPRYLIKGFADDLAKCYISDLVTAYKPADYQKEVQLTFRNLATKVRIALYETIPGYSVKNVKFYTDNATTIATGASATSATLFAPNTGAEDVFYAKVNATVEFPTIGSGNKSKSDYNKAHVTMSPIASGSTKYKAFGTLNYTTKEDREAAGSYLARNSTTPTFAGDGNANYYANVLPNETGTILELRVDYTLVSTDGSGEEINIHGATAYVPQIYASWRSNYAYTYIFKISDNTNGWTSTVDTDPSGLFPITFDAVVVDAEENQQSTITTVATPSITTYQKGHDYSAQETYAAGDIYVQVMTGTTLEDNLNTNSYLYTLSDDDATEASVMDAISIQAYNVADLPATIEGRNGLTLTKASSALTNTGVTTIPGVDGNDITVDDNTAAKITAAASTTYAFIYDTEKYNGIYLAEEPADFASYFSDEKCTTPVGAWSAAGTFYKRTSEIRSYVELVGAAPSDWNKDDNVYYSDEACTTKIASGYTSLHKVVMTSSDPEPSDWGTGEYFTDTDCTIPADNVPYVAADVTYFKKIKCYKKFAVNNRIYGVKVIKVQ